MILILPWIGIVLIRAFGLLVANFGAPGWLILDDVLIPKQYAKKIQAAYWDWDHSLKRNLFGQKTNTAMVLEGCRYQVSSIGKHIGPLHYYRPPGLLYRIGRGGLPQSRAGPE